MLVHLEQVLAKQVFAWELGVSQVLARDLSVRLVLAPQAKKILQIGAKNTKFKGQNMVLASQIRC